jgi:hypothetical protein
MVALNYNAEGQEGMSERSALPEGEYVAAIVKNERREAKSGNGNAYLNLEFEVQDGPAKGRRFWTMLNLWNSNAQAAEIAQRELTSICHAVGRLRVGDADELNGIPMLVKVGIDKADKDRNVVKGYKPLNGGMAPANTGGHVQQGVAAGGDSGPAWRRPKA